MTNRRAFLLKTGGILLGAAFLPKLTAFAASATSKSAPPDAFEVTHTAAEWHARLNAAQYNVLREEGTERPYSSPLNDEHHAGTFSCAGCALPLFSSTTKFDSGTRLAQFL